MGTKGPALAVNTSDFASALLAQREGNSRAQTIASFFSEVIPDAATVVYTLVNGTNTPVWRQRASSGEVSVDAELAAHETVLDTLRVQPRITIYDGEEIAREAYAHLDLRRTMVSWALVPLLVAGEVVGALEFVSFAEKLSVQTFSGLGRALELSATALSSAIAYEEERNSQLLSISRITQFYDLEKTFNATLEIEELLPVIASKFREILGVQAVNLWMVETAETLLMANRAGSDDTIEVHAVLHNGEGPAFDVSESGESVVISDPHDERLLQRNKGVKDGSVFSMMLAPLLDKEQCVGVAEIINKMDGTPFDDDDLFLLMMIGQTASNALHNAALLQSERKAQVLQTLVDVSNEITSTLNLGRVLQTIVNGPQAVIPFERSSISLEQNGALRLRAVSGMRQINYGDASVVALRDLSEWLSFTRDDLFITQKEDEITGTGEEAKHRFREYFAGTGMRSFYARVLADDQGRLGILTYESSNPDFLTHAHVELIKILSGQATVALRNAQLYQQVPFISVIEPFMERKRRFMAMEKRRRVSIGTLAAVLLLFLVFVPVPLRVDGGVTVAPTRTATVQPEFDSVVKRVYVREGDVVRRGAILADMDDWEIRRSLAEAEAKYAMATSDMNRALAANDGTTAGIQRTNVAYWGAEVGRAKERLDRTHLRSPIDGVVATPYIENFTGRKLDAGDKFAEIANTSHAMVDVGIEEQDLALLTAGLPARVKLDGYPTKVFRGAVSVVSPKGQAVGDQNLFFARVDVPNQDGAVRPGMLGRGKINTGWHSAGYVLLRRPAMWVWGKLWSWFGY